MNKIRTCTKCKQTKTFYNNNPICSACVLYFKAHGKYKSAPIRIRDGLKTKHKQEYNIYRGMKNRCYNRNNHKYAAYGGRGIKVCDRWLGPYGFHNFYADMNERPSKEYSLDRIDVNGDYCPENCRWANIHTQASNKRNLRVYSNEVGVTYNKSLGLWVATLQVNGERFVAYAKTEAIAIENRKKLLESYLL